MDTIALNCPLDHIGQITGMSYVVPTEEMSRRDPNEVKEVIFNDPATIVIWGDGTKTVVKCTEGDAYDPRLGFLLCVAKRHFGNTGRYLKVMERHGVPEEGLFEWFADMADGMRYEKKGD